MTSKMTNWTWETGLELVYKMYEFVHKMNLMNSAATTEGFAAMTHPFSVHQQCGGLHLDSK